MHFHFRHRFHLCIFLLIFDASSADANQELENIPSTPTKRPLLINKIMDHFRFSLGSAMVDFPLRELKQVAQSLIRVQIWFIYLSQSQVLGDAVHVQDERLQEQNTYDLAFDQGEKR